jgi:Tfp pilus assembly protein PilO
MRFGLRETIFVVVLMCIPVSAWWFVLRPMNERKAEMIKEIEANQEKLRALNRVTGTIGDLQKEIEARRQAIDYFQAKLPSEKEIDRVLEEVWRLAETNRLITKSIRTLKRKQSSLTSGGGPSEQPIAVQLEGDFHGFYTFLQALENQPRIMRIQEMSLGKLRDAPEGSVKASFEMFVFFEPDNEG